MFKHGLLMALALAAAVGIPYAATTSDPGSWLSGIWTSFTGSGEDDTTTGEQVAVEDNLYEPRIEGIPAHNLGEVIQFDATPGWITSRWSRVSTVPGDGEFQGYRVPLVTGTDPAAVAGSLTYYFDQKNKVQRIKFTGSTGDVRDLVSLVTVRFQLTRQNSTEPGLLLYQAKWNGRPTSELRIRLADVIRTDTPDRRFHIDMEINLPEGQMSRDSVSQAKADKESQVK